LKLIYPDNISSITADAENASYPAANLLDDHPKKVFKGKTKRAVITAVVTGGGALAIIATNAVSIRLVLSTGQTIEWDYTYYHPLSSDGVRWDPGEVSWDTSGDTTTTERIKLTGDIDGVAWFDFEEERTSNYTATITLVAEAGQIIQAGVIKSGTLRTFVDPAYGIQEGLEDYSVEKELNNGAFYYRKRDIATTFDFQIVPARDPDFYTFIRTVAKANGKQPLAWRISTNNTDSEWIVFARFADMPRGSHDYPAYSPIDVSIVEVL
jgi:hypothetical protein